MGSRSAIFAYDTLRFVGGDLAVTHPETTSGHIRIIIHNEDNPPLDVQRVEVYGVRRALVFSADPSRSYSLYYGNADARRPSYDIERVLPYLATEELPEARLGPQANNPEFVEAPEPVSERLPWLFPFVVALAAAVVALLLVAVLRQARKVLPPPPDEP